MQRGNLIPDLKEWIQDAFPNLLVDDVFTYITNWLTSNLAEIGGSIGQGVLVASGAVLGGLFGAFIVLILTIYLTASTPSLKRAVYQLAPGVQARPLHRSVRADHRLRGLLRHGPGPRRASSTVSLSAVYLSIIDAPFPAVLRRDRVLLLASSPLVGTLTGSTIIVLVCLIPGLGPPATAIAAAIYYLIYMQIEAYIISPRIMSRAVSVPGAVVVVAAPRRRKPSGLLGALIAIPRGGEHPDHLPSGADPPHERALIRAVAATARPRRRHRLGTAFGRLTRERTTERR